MGAMFKLWNSNQPQPKLPSHHRHPSVSRMSGWHRRRMLRWCLGLIVGCFLLSYCMEDQFFQDAYSQRSPNDFSLEFKLAEEVALSSYGERIPKIVHFVYGLRDPRPTLDLIHYLAIKSAHDIIQPDKIMFHYHYLPEGDMFERARPMLTLRQIPLTKKVFRRPVHHYAHRADVARLEVLREFGGIYLDLDLISLKPLDHLLEQEFVMAQEGQGGSVGLCNAMILARPNARFLQRWYATYAAFLASDWNRHSVVLPGKLATLYPDEITVLNDKSFFWPLWDTDGLRTLYLEKTFDFGANLGTHIWESPANRHLMKNITEQVILNVDNSLYCQLRPFLLDGRPDSRPEACLILNRTQLPDDLVGHWPLEAPVGPLEYTNPMRAEDVSGNHLGGIIRNGYFEATQPTGVHLTGRDSYIFLTLPKETTIHAFTASWWMLTNSDKINGTALVIQTDRAKVYVRTESVSPLTAESRLPPVSVGLAVLERDDDWAWREKQLIHPPLNSKPINDNSNLHHYALVVDKNKDGSTQLTLYIDGHQAVSSNAWTMPSHFQTVVRGVWLGSSEPERSYYQDPWDMTRSLEATYHDIHIWSRPLKHGDILDAMQTYLQRQKEAIVDPQPF